MKSIHTGFFRFEVFALLMYVVALNRMDGNALTDYGAIPSITKPSGDQSAANQKLDYHTDLFTGRFNYKIPIKVPPGRQGSEPDITLQYNSSDGNGWCGVGWDLDMGYIQRETRYGVPSSGLYSDSNGFVFSFAGQSGRLIHASDGSYRPEINTSFLKFNYLSTSGYWVVTDKSGRKYFFGEASSERIANGSGTFKWALDRITDANGNKTTLTYQTVSTQLYLKQIDYNANTNSPSISANCTVTFTLETTTRSDAPNSCLSGTEIYTTRRLSAITVLCNGTRVRNYALQYITSPSTGRSLLSSVTEYGVNDSWAFPAMTFKYQVQANSFQPSAAWTVVPQNQRNDGTGISPGTPYAQLVDINGDGLPDWVTTPVNQPFNYFNVQLNTGNGFGSVQSWSPVANEGNDPIVSWNAINAPFSDITGFSIDLTELMDINGDGLPDRVMRQYANDIDGGLSHLEVQTNNGTGFSSVFEMTGVNSQSPDFSASILNTPSATAQGGMYSIATLIDMNGDGLPDRVMTGSSSATMDVQLNQGGSFSSIVHWSNVASEAGIGGSLAYAPRARGNYYALSDLMDMNGDGLPDRLVRGGIQLNDGSSRFGSLQSWGLGSTEDPETLDAITAECYLKQLIDINGDGLPDLVATGSSGTYTVRFNNGSGFASSPVTWTGVDTTVYASNDGILGWDALQAWDSADTKITFIDMNGDGLPDRVIRNANNANSIMVQLNTGPFPDLLTVVSNGIGGSVTATYAPSTKWNNSDGTRSRIQFPVYTVTSVAMNDGINKPSTWTYSYLGGLYDTVYREFRGFAKVDETDPLGMITETYFHQGGGLNLSSHGKYQDSRFKAGMPYDVLTYGSDGLVHKETLSQIDQVQVDSTGVYFPFAKQIFEIDSEVSKQSRATLKKYKYDVTANNLAASTGNLLIETNLGEVASINYSTFTCADVADPPVYTTYNYAHLANTDIIDEVATNAVLDAPGGQVLRQTIYQYDGHNGNITNKSELICPGTYAVTTYGHDIYGNVTAITNPVGIVSTINYDSATATFPIKKYTGLLADNLIEYSQYDLRSGEIIVNTNEQGLVTSNAYDGLLRLTNSVISTTPNSTPTLWRTQYQYNLGGISSAASFNYVRVLQNDPADSVNGYHETYSYFDGLGRIIQTHTESEANGYRINCLVYDARGSIMFEGYPFFSTFSSYIKPSGPLTNVYTQYDPIGRISRINPCAFGNFTSGVFNGNTPTVLTGDGGSPIGPVSFAYHDGNDPWVIVVTDALGKIHKYSEDAFGRTNKIVEVTSQGNFTTLLAYDQVDNLTNITDNAGNQISFFYDCLGRQVAVSDPDMGFWQYRYDAAGDLVQQIDAAGQMLKLYYSDPAGRLTRREGYNTSSQIVSTNTYQYDSNGGDGAYAVYRGQLFEVTDDQGWEKSSYDVRDRTLKTVRYLIKNGNIYTNQFTYDDADRLGSILYPNGGPTVTNNYDTGENLSLVKRVDSGGANVAFYTPQGFDALDRLTGINFGNGVATTFNYYKVSKRLNQITTVGAGSTTIQNFTNRYDAVGNVVGLQDNVSGHTGLASATISSAVYDDLNRVTSITWAGYGQKSYSYNSIGNMMLNGEAGSGAYNYGTARPHLVKSANGVTYTCDPNGNVTSRGGQTLSYDVYNHLVQVINPDGVVTTFGYDAGGARLWEASGTNNLQVWIGNTYEEKQGQILYHIYANGKQVCTFDKTATNVFEYYHPDYLTSTSLLTDTNGNQIQHYEYTAFGQTRYTGSTTAFVPSRRYTGQVFDDATGLYYYNARYYDPELGRFIQPDDVIQDLSNPQSYNRYSYCVNDPLRYTDPTGKDFVLNAGLVPGPVPYMTARSTVGQIGASVYNMFPLVDNSIHQGLRGVAAVDRAAGDVLHATTFAVTGDPQLAENSRNLTLLVGGVGELGKIAKVDEAVVTGAKALPDEALVVRGGQNLPQNFSKGSGVSVGENGALNGVSVQSANGVDVKTLSQNIPHNQVGVTTVGDVRAAGGNVVHSPTPGNPHHSTLSGVNANTASDLFRPTIPNPAKQ